MRIALVRRGYSATGGAEAYLRRLAQGLVETGEEVIFYTSAEWPTAAWEYGEVRRIPGHSPLTFARALQSSKKDFDCLLSLERILGCDLYRAGDGVHASWLQRRARFESPWRRWLRGLNRKHTEILKLERVIFDPRHTGIIVANSRMVQEEIAKYYQFPKERILLIPNGFFAPAFSFEDRIRIRQKYGFSAEETVVLFTGTGWERKGLRFAVRAIDALQGRAKLLVAGRGPSRKYAGSHTVFAGPVSHMAALYMAADIFLLPTLYDPFSNACLEALAAGLPVITTLSNGFSEVLENSALGDRVEVGDDQALIQALERWLPAEVRKKTRQIRIQIASRFSMEENIRNTLNAIRIAIETRASY